MKFILLILLACAQNQKVYTVKIKASSKEERSVISNYFPIDSVQKEHVIVTAREEQVCLLKKIFNGHYDVLKLEKLPSCP